MRLWPYRALDRSFSRTFHLFYGLYYLKCSLLWGKLLDKKRQGLPFLTFEILGFAEININNEIFTCNSDVLGDINACYLCKKEGYIRRNCPIISNKFGNNSTKLKQVVSKGHSPSANTTMASIPNPNSSSMGNKHVMDNFPEGNKDGIIANLNSLTSAIRQALKDPVEISNPNKGPNCFPSPLESLEMSKLNVDPLSYSAISESLSQIREPSKGKNGIIDRIKFPNIIGLGRKIHSKWFWTRLKTLLSVRRLIWKRKWCLVHQLIIMTVIKRC